MKKRSQVLETVVHGVFLLLGLITVGCVLLISVYLIVSGIPAIRQIGLVPFLFGKTWASTAAEPSYGILPFILTSVYGTAGAIVLGVPLGFLTAVYLAKVAPPRLKAVLESAVSLLAGIPSVVYGLVGMLVLVPGIRKVFHLSDGASLLAAIVVLAIMILPSIIKVSVTALEAVPPEYEDASLALGATPIETYFKVSVPAAKSGIAAAVVLGVGRAIGEAMAVMMVSGNVPNMPSLFQSVRFLTTAVASEMSYSSGLQRQALFSIALVLVPGIRRIFHIPDGSGLLAAIIVLAIMILPSIINVAMTALEAVPKEYEDASLALGATATETWFRVSVPAARSGIAAAVVLGVGRAIGEAMAVMMVSGNRPNMPSLFESVRFLTTAVASEMGYAAAGLQRQALFSIALVLFLFIMLINAALNFSLKRSKEK